MFGHVFQKNSSVPAEYRRLAWIRSDGRAFIDIGYPGPEGPLTGHIGMEMTVMFPAQENVRPGTMFGAKNGVDFQLTATEKKIYTPDTVSAAGTVVEEGTVGPNSCSVTISRGRLGVPTTVTVAADGVSGSAEWSGTLESGSAFINTFTSYLCYVKCYNSSENVFAVYFSDNPFLIEATVFSAKLPAQTQVGVEYFDHKAELKWGSLYPWTFENLATNMLATATAKRLRVINSIQELGLWYKAQLDDTYYWQEYENPPATVEFTQNNLFVFARNTGWGAAENFCRDMKLQQLKIVDEVNVGTDTHPDYRYPAIREFYPAIRIADNKVGLYDTTTKEFFTNRDGAFEYQELT